jgi:signal transduction histidine kinase
MKLLFFLAFLAITPLNSVALEQAQIKDLPPTYGYDTSNEIKALHDLSRHNARQRDEIIVVAACLIVALIVLFFYYQKTIRLNKKLVAHEKQLQELNEMKDKLFSVIGHDLRGPIARISAMIGIFEVETTTTEEKKYLLDNLKEHTRSSLETFDKLLYWGQSLMKGVKLHKFKMQTSGYVKEAIAFKKIKAAEKNIRITDNTPPDTRVFADPSLFDFIIRNLLANALKYTWPGGAIEINADTALMPGYIVFSVKDNGTGMDKATLSRLFSPLESRQGTENEKGHGIGLMLCKEFAIQNGGDMWVDSEEGRGSVFYFCVQKAD